MATKVAEAGYRLWERRSPDTGGHYVRPRSHWARNFKFKHGGAPRPCGGRRCRADRSKHMPRPKSPPENISGGRDATPPALAQRVSIRSPTRPNLRMPKTPSRSMADRLVHRYVLRRKLCAVWLNRTRRSSSVGGDDRRHSLPRSTPRLTAGRSLIVARQRATFGNSSSGWPKGLAISTHAHDDISAI